jgi:hypothetical protein
VDVDGEIFTYPIQGKGMKIDLKKGSLTGYNFELVAGNETEEGKYYLKITSNTDLDSDGNFKEKPLTIGPNFSVEWDGSITATNGNFTGKITAITGTIGGWNFTKNVLYKGGTATNKEDDDETLEKFTVASGSAIIAPKADVEITGLSFKNSIYTPGESTKDSTTGITTTVEGSWGTEESQIKDIVFAIGKNFAIDKDGIIYATGAQLDGFVNTTEVSDLSDTLIKIA